MKSNNKNTSLTILVIVLVTVFSSQCTRNQQATEKESMHTCDNWFETTLVADKVWRIDDHGDDNIYLVEGDDKALLIDTGNGIADLAECAKDITKLPLLVVNTHGHPDHIGGNFQFSEVYAHPLDFELIELFSSEEYHNMAIQQAIREHPELESLFMKNIAEYKPPSIVAIEAGHIFDLGSRKLEVIEVPGHTGGSIVLLDTENKLLFTGDNHVIQ